MGDLISRQYVLNKLLRNNIFSAITNAEGLSAIDIVQNAPDAFPIVEESDKNIITNADRIRNMDNAELSDTLYKSHCFMCEYYQKEIHTCGSPKGFMCSPSHVKSIIDKWLESEVDNA